MAIIDGKYYPDGMAQDLAALRAENQRLRLRLSECADELARLDRHGDNVTRQIRADARAALKGAE